MADQNPGFLKIVNSAKSKIKQYTVDQVWHRFQAGDGGKFHFIDVREDEEWAAGRAKGSIHLGKGVIERDIESAVSDKSSEIILYCGGGFRSALAAEALQTMGYSNVASMDGGIREWRQKGLPEER